MMPLASSSPLISNVKLLRPCEAYSAIEGKQEPVLHVLFRSSISEQSNLNDGCHCHEHENSYVKIQTLHLLYIVKCYTFLRRGSISIAHLLVPVGVTIAHFPDENRTWSLTLVGVHVSHEYHTRSLTPIGVRVSDEDRTWSFTPVSVRVSGEDSTWSLTPVGSSIPDEDHIWSITFTHVPFSGEDCSWSATPQPTPVFSFSSPLYYVSERWP